MIIPFKRNAEYYIKMSEDYEKRSDLFRSLLYARRSAETGDIKGRLRLADLLLQYSDSTLALKEYLNAYLEGEHSARIYVGLIKGFSLIGRYSSATFFISEGIRQGVLSDYGIDVTAGRKEVIDYVKELFKDYPSPKIYEIPERMFYALSRGDIFQDRIYLSDMCPRGELIEPELIYNLISVVPADKIDKNHAKLLLKMTLKEYDGKKMPTSVLAGIVVSALALDKKDVLDKYLRQFYDAPTPDNPIELFHCLGASLSLSDDQLIAEHLEALLDFCYNEKLLLAVAVANVKCEDYSLAEDYFSRALVLNPHSYIARYWLKRLRAKEYPTATLAELLPTEELAQMKEKIDRCSKGETNQREIDLIAKHFISARNDYSRKVACALINTPLLPIVKKELLSPHNKLEFLRDVIAELLYANNKEIIQYFFYGVCQIKLSGDYSEFADGVRRAFTFAEVTLRLLSVDKTRKLKVLADRAQSISEVETEEKIQSLAGAIVYVARPNGTVSVDRLIEMFPQAKREIILKYCKVLSDKKRDN